MITQIQTTSKAFRPSAQQRRLWSAQRPEDRFVTQGAVLVEGNLDAARLRQAVEQTVAGQEILRTRFVRRPGQRFPVQVVEPEGEAEWGETLGSFAPSGDLRTQATLLLEQERARGFDLAGDPVLRLRLADLGRGRHLLLLTLPALCADRRGLENLVREIGRAYAGAAPAGDANDAEAEETVQYADFSEWQEQLLAEEDEETVEARAFWERAADPTFGNLTLPEEEAREIDAPFVPQARPIALAPALAERLAGVAQGLEVSLPQLLLAAWQVLLWRLTGQETLAVGRLFPGRSYDALEDLLGLFERCLPVTGSLDAAAPFGSFLGQMAEAESQALGRQLLADLDRIPAYAAAFETIEAPAPWAAASLRFSFCVQHVCCERFKVKLCCLEEEGTLRLELQLDSSRFSAGDAERLGERLGRLLEEIAADPGRPLGDLDLLTGMERWELLEDLNATRRELAGAGRAWHELFERQAAATPGSPALVFEGERLTYRQLNGRANALARRLRALGVGPEVRVALWAERSAGLVVGLLATLKAGGAYVPLDPGHPHERVMAMLAEAGARVLLTQASLAASLPEPGIAVALLEDGLAGFAEDDLGVAVDGRNLAYILFTSGSTGQPKGVAVEHRQLTDYVLGVAERLEMEPGWQFAVVSTFAADLGNTAVFPALTTGGCLHVVAPSRLSDPDALGELFAREAIDCLKIVPSHLVALLSAADPARILPRHLLVLGGEKSVWELIEEVSRLAPGCRVANHYGPTESTVGALARPVGASETGAGGVPLGRPLPNAEAYVLNSRGLPVPAGVAGELYLGGAGLARGYLGRPDWTADRFVPHSFSTEPGARLYRTGDRVRYHRGELEFLGRVDHQVKLRGFRIELGEIEALLRSRPEVREAVVVLREEGAGAGRLVAYVTGRPRREPDVAALLAFLRERLPEVMVPSALVVLPALPLTANGKVDRRALPAPERAQPARGAYVAPGSETEERLAGIWATVLGVQRVGVEDNFFELGGDSILAIQVIARANRVGIRLNPQQLFEHQTISRLAAVAGTAPEAVAEQGSVTGDVLLTPIQRWFFEQDFADPAHWNQALWVDLEEAPPAAALESAVAALLAHHDSLRSRFVAGPDGVRQHVAAPAESSNAFVRIDLTALPDPEAALEAAAAQVQASLDLARGPIVRAALFERRGGRPSRLLLALHHLVVDGVSWRVLMEDLATALDQLRRGEAIELAPKTTSFQRWAERLAAHAQSTAMEPELAYWLAALPEQRPALPVDGVRQRSSVATQRRHVVALGPEETRALLQEVPPAYRTQINDVLLTALARGVARWSGERSLYVHLEGHGRENLFDDVDLSRTVGWFTSRYPVLLEAGDPARPGDALKAVKERLRQVPARGLGYLVLRSLTGSGEGGEALRSRPEPEIKFNYLGQLDAKEGTVGLGGIGAMGQVGGAQGAERSERSHLSWLLNIDGGVAGGKLFLRWTYSSDAYRDATIECLAQTVVEELESLVAHCLSAEAGGCTASDFPLSGLGQAELDTLLAGLSGGSAHRAIEDIYITSPLQKSLLFHSLASPGSTVGFEQKSSTLRGAFDPDLFRRTWQLALDRHPILRTSFVSDGLEEPVQVVWRRLELPLDLQDWRGVPADEQQARLEGYLRADRRRGFDPGRAPLLRLALIRLDDDRVQLVWSYHHLLIDAWCRNLLQKEIFTIYDALGRGQAPDLPATFPYRSYIAWLRQQDLDRARELWRRELMGYRPLPQAVRPARGTRHEESYGQRALQLSAAETERLETFARQERVTVGTLLHAAWGLVLSRHLTTGDIVVGSTVSGRPPDLEGIESILGMFINNLPVRLRIPRGARLSPWLHELQGRLTEMRLLEWTAPGQIQEWCDLPAGQRLFDSLVIFQSYPVEEVPPRESAGGPEILSFRSRMETSYPLTVVAGPMRPLGLRLFFDTRWYDQATVERLLGHLRMALLGIAEDGDRTLADLSLLTPAERQELVVDWNRRPEPDETPLHRRILDHARSYSGRIAVEEGEERETWGGLAHRAGELAGALVRAGVAPGDRVAVRAGTGPELAAALLGVLEAGAAFVALDPTAPVEEQLGFAPGVSVLVTGLVVSRLGEEGSEAPAAREVSGDPPACVLLGNEAGSAAVELSHAALARVASALEGLHPQTADGTVLVLPEAPWQVAVDLLAALALGARVVLAGSGETDGERLARRLVASGATLLQASPSTWISLLQAGWTGNPQLAAVSRGESLSRGLAERLLAKTAAVYTVRGSRETAGCSMAGRVETGRPGEDSPLGIGRPAAGVRLYLLSEDLQPVPAGRPGWIFAAGRIARQALTDPRFVPDLLADVPGSRAFFTGDLGRLLSDCRLEILGHAESLLPVADFYRSDMEVESVLRGQPDLLDSAVSVWEDEAGESHLVAHVVPYHPAFPSVEELNGYLRARLPRAIVPTLFMKALRLPRTREGRIDRRALPSPRQEGQRAMAPYVPPCNALELRLKQIWEELFGFRPIGIQDDFFELGGHSLLAIRLIARIREELGRELPLTSMLRASTIENLAQAIEEQEEEPAWTPLVPIRTAGTKPPIFCIHALGGEVLTYTDLARFLGPDQPVYGLQSRAWSSLPLEDSASLEEMAAEYLAAIRSVQSAGPYRILGYSFGGVVALEMARQLNEQGETLSLLAILDTLITGEGANANTDVPEILSGLVHHHPSVSVDHLRRLGDMDAQIVYFVERTNEVGIIPGLDLRVVRSWARGFLSHRKVRHAYEPKPFAGRITLLRAEEGNVVRTTDPTLGWGSLSAGGLDIVDVPGNHDSAVQLPHVQTLARKLREILSSREERLQSRSNVI